MYIDKIELYLVENKFREPWRTAYGSDDGNCVVMARLISGEHEGWGEASPLPGPTYCGEWGEGAFEVVKRFLAPALVGKDMPDYHLLRFLPNQCVQYRKNFEPYHVAHQRSPTHCPYNI